MRVTGDAGFLAVDAEIHSDPCQSQRMAQRNQIAGTFGAHDGGNPRNAKHITFFRGAGFDDCEGFGFHPDGSGGNGDTVRFFLVADINHMRLAGRVKVR